MKTLDERKNIFKKIIKEFQYSDDNSKIIIWDVLVESLASDDTEIKNKTYNLLNLLNETKQKSEEDFNILMDRDIEEDLWYNV